MGDAERKINPPCEKCGTETLTMSDREHPTTWQECPSCGERASEGKDLAPRAVHCKREPFDVYIGRPSKWGNPFQVGVDGTREEVIAKYEAWLNFDGVMLLGDVQRELRGKVLGCWCAPKACHGDVLVRLANA